MIIIIVQEVILAQKLHVGAFGQNWHAVTLYIITKLNYRIEQLLRM